MSQSTSTQHKLIPFDFDIMVRICEKDPAAKKEDIFLTLRSAIYGEYRKYAKAKKLKSAGPNFTHARCITFEFDQPKPSYGKVMTYRLHFGPDGVTVSLITPNPDPEFAPFLEPVNLSQVKNEFFDPAEFEPRRRKIAPPPVARPANNPTTAAINQQASVISIPEVRLITVCCAPTSNQEGDDLPYLRFGGEYLKKYGFKVGSRVSIRIERNRIIIINSDELEVGRQLA